MLGIANFLLAFYCVFFERFAINSDGDIPIAFLKEFEKYRGSENPDRRATFFTELIPSSKSDIAY